MAFLVLAVLAVLRTLLLLVLARRHARQPAPAAPVRRVALPAVSVVVPAYNEELGIAASGQVAGRQRLPGDLEIIVVDDGSTDGTADDGRGRSACRTCG